MAGRDGAALHSSTMLTRREWLRASVALLVSKRFFASVPITVYKTPSCGCCKKWVQHLEANGFAVTVHDMDNLDEVKRTMGVPDALQSCHTGLVGRYVIEGHVPADLVHKLLAEKPSILGLAVPGMPSGSPGMEGARKDRYNVIAFDRGGKTKLYASR